MDAALIILLLLAAGAALWLFLLRAKPAATRRPKSETPLAPGASVPKPPRLRDALRRQARKFLPIASLKEQPREEAIELAREILRRLRDMKFSDKSLKELIDQGTPEALAEFGHKLAEMANIITKFQRLRSKIQETDPTLLLHPLMEDAGGASDTFTHAIKLMAAKEMPGSVAAAQQISADKTQQPEQWKDLQHRTVNRLLASLESGLAQSLSAMEQQQEAMQEQNQEMAQEMAESALMQHQHTGRRKKKKVLSGMGAKRHQKQRLALMADDYALKQGRFAASGDGASLPALMRKEAERKECTQQLERLREVTLAFANDPRLAGKTLREVCEGPADAMAAFDRHAQTIAAAAAVLRQAAGDASRHASGLPDGMQRRQEAGDAATSFTYAIGLMAAKELPGSVAAAQQISADVTRRPEQWRDLQSRTVGRLLTSMEGGLADSLAAIEQQQEAMQEQNQEMAQELAESALLHQQSGTRRRKRRRFFSGLGAKRAGRQRIDLMADDYVLKQGRFRDMQGGDARPVTAPAAARENIAEVKAADLSLAKELGQSLRSIGDSLKGLAVSQATSVPDGERVLPGDKPYALQQALDKEKGPAVPDQSFRR